MRDEAFYLILCKHKKNCLGTYALTYCSTNYPTNLAETGRLLQHSEAAAKSLMGSISSLVIKFNLICYVYMKGNHMLLDLAV